MFSFAWQTILFAFLAELLYWHSIQQTFGYHSAEFYFLCKKKKKGGREEEKMKYDSIVNSMYGV
jgi:hypothetical protein